MTVGLDQTTTYLYGLGRLAAYDSAGSPAYFLTDHVGSVRQIAAPGGSILERCPSIIRQVEDRVPRADD